MSDNITTIAELRDAIRDRHSYYWAGGAGEVLSDVDLNKIEGQALVQNCVVYGWTARRKSWQPEVGKLIYVSNFEAGPYFARIFCKTIGSEYIAKETPLTPNAYAKYYTLAKPIPLDEVSK